MAKPSEDIRAGMTAEAEEARWIAQSAGLPFRKRRLEGDRVWIHRMVSRRMTGAPSAERKAVADYLMAAGGVPKVCPITGDLIMLGYGNDFSPALVAIDPHKPLAPGNAAIVSMRAARIKSDGTAEEHARIAAWMKKQL